MEGAKERAKMGGRVVPGHLNNTQVHSPSNHHTNMIVQTGSVQKSSRETDLQKAITDYQTKVIKQKPGKNKHATARSMTKTNGGESAKHGPLSQKKLADTYMVGGNFVDLNNTYSS